MSEAKLPFAPMLLADALERMIDIDYPNDTPTLKAAAAFIRAHVQQSFDPTPEGLLNIGTRVEFKSPVSGESLPGIVVGHNDGMNAVTNLRSYGTCFFDTSCLRIVQQAQSNGGVSVVTSDSHSVTREVYVGFESVDAARSWADANIPQHVGVDYRHVKRIGGNKQAFALTPLEIRRVLDTLKREWAPWTNPEREVIAKLESALNG